LPLNFLLDRRILPVIALFSEADIHPSPERSSM
jgi:hypothetical protein